MSKLWVVTSYFNPARWTRRLTNYHHFRRQLAAPLLAVELSFGESQPALRPGDADILVHVSDGDVMWQKERLLNVALQHLPPSCTHVAWIDCDIVFDNDGWVADAGRQLAEVPVVQLFDEVVHAARDADPAAIRTGSPGWTQPSLVHSMRSASDARQPMANALLRNQGAPAMGMAWAARRELLDRHGLYDRSIAGGGDTAFVGGVLGLADVVTDMHSMNAAQRTAYDAWARAVHEDVQGCVGVLTQKAHHLWHGEMADRSARSRHVHLADLGFDPMLDLATGRDGAWRWARDKPALREFLAGYFAARHEDGR